MTCVRAKRLSVQYLHLDCSEQLSVLVVICWRSDVDGHTKQPCDQGERTNRLVGVAITACAGGVHLGAASAQP